METVFFQLCGTNKVCFSNVEICHLSPIRNGNQCCHGPQSKDDVFSVSTTYDRSQWIQNRHVSFKANDNHGVRTDQDENTLSIAIDIANKFTKWPETWKDAIRIMDDVGVGYDIYP